MVKGRLFFPGFLEKHWEFFACFFVLCFFALPQLFEFFAEDELDFARTAVGLAETGRPVYYKDELSPSEFGLWHPVLYAGLVAFCFRVFGESVVSARLVSFFSNVLALFFVVYVSRLFFGEKSRAGLLAGLFFALSPFVVQNSVLVDIDNSLLTLLVPLFLFLYFGSRKNARNIFLFSVFFCVLLWAKLGWLPAGVSTVFLLAFFDRSSGKSFWEAFVCVGLGCAFFLLTWGAYCAFLDLPFEKPFLHNLSAGAGQLGSKYFLVAGYVLKTALLWFSPSFLALAFFSSVFFLREYRKHDPRLLALVLFSVLTFLEYAAIGRNAHGYVRYFAPAFPGFCVAVSGFLVRELKGFLDRKFLPRYVGVGLFLPVFLFMLFPDPVSPFPIDTSRLVELQLLPAAVYLALFLVFLTASAFLFGKDRYRGFLLGCVVTCFSAGFYLCVVQLTAPYSVNYNYKEKGFAQVVDFVRSSTSPGEIIVSPRDVAYHADRRFVEDSRFYYDLDVSGFSELNVSLAVFSSVLLSEEPGSLDRLEGFVETNEFGSFVVYERVS